ncbi:MAG: N-acetylmannosamine-6-phosphate 2-epimerase [Anaerolineaceae bacterium]|nr:MAG: N-acetylmannosamine-6-phosphate 2-epimerase [Anaerolineaceae bacterium]
MQTDVTPQRSRFIARVRGRLIVSCQALEDEPLHGADIMARMALAAAQGGAVAIRANGVDDIRAIRQTVDLPIIGLYKSGDQGIYITPTIDHALAVLSAGADVVAFDATNRPRPNGETITGIIAAIHERGGLALADVSTFDEGMAAQSAGADFVAPTLAGYTAYSTQLDGPDFALITRLVAELATPIIAEGRIRTPDEATQALQTGALAVVVGSAITRPQLITAEFARALPQVTEQNLTPDEK